MIRTKRSGNRSGSNAYGRRDISHTSYSTKLHFRNLQKLH